MIQEDIVTRDTQETDDSRLLEDIFPQGQLVSLAHNYAISSISPRHQTAPTLKIDINPQRLNEVLQPMNKIEQIYSVLFYQIDGLTELTEGWDGEDALPISQTTIMKSKNFIFDIIQKAIQKAATNTEIKWFAPNIAPTRDGGISFSWERQGYWIVVTLDGQCSSIPLTTKQPGQRAHVISTDEDHALKAIMDFFHQSSER